MGHKYRELLVWQRAIELAREVYSATQEFPKNEIYGLTSQMRRAAISVPSNVAEGQGRLNRGEFRQFLGQARGSLLELDTQAHLASLLGFLPQTSASTIDSKIQEVLRMLNALISKLETSLISKLET